MDAVSLSPPEQPSSSTPYRVAFVVCKAIALNLWINAAIGALGLAAIVVLKATGVYSLGYLGGWTWIGQGVVALVLGAVAPALSAALTAQPTLQGEALAARQVLAPGEKALMRAIAGLLLLVFGVAGLAGSLSALYSIATWKSSPAYPFVWPIVVSLIGIALRIAAGFMLAFGPNLRRVVAPKTL